MLEQRIKEFFAKKEKGEITKTSPKGMCPVCWGHNEWDGHYYKMVRDKHTLSNSDVYENFISKIVDKHVNTTHKHENKYTCLTCNNEIE